MVIGDLNARIGNMQTATTVLQETNLSNIYNNRTSKDTVYNQNGTKLLDILQNYDLCILNGCTEGDREGHYTFIGGQGKSVIDYCAVNNDWVDLITKFEVQTKTYSDHLPIVIEWTNNAIRNEKTLNLLPRMNWKIQKINIYHEAIDNFFSNTVLNTESVEEYSSQVISCIRSSSSIKMTTGEKFYKQKWFDSECSKFRKKSFALLHAWRETDSEVLKKWYAEANTSYKNMCRVKKINWENNKAIQLANIKNSKEFWKATKEINGSKFKIGTGVSAAHLSLYFQTLLRDQRNITFLTAEPLIVDDILDCEISLVEIENVLKKSKNGKAPGEDGALDKAENYRGISFMNTIGKLFCGILVARLEKWIDENNTMTELQAGFRKNYSTIDHIFSLTAIVKGFQARNKKVYALFVDFKAAFDLIHRNALLYKLSQIGLSTKFIQIIKEMYCGTNAAVWDGNNISDWFETDSGVKQGCPLSALLFALFINDVVTELPGGIRIAGTIVNVLLYADDLVILSENPQNLQLMINRLVSFCEKWGLIINTDKSKVMVFSRNNRGNPTQNYNWFLGTNRLDVVREYTYLGVMLNTTLDFKTHFEEKTKTCQKLINSTWNNVLFNEHVSLSTKYKIFDSVVKSTLCYAAEVWGTDEFEEMEKLQRSFIKKLFNLPIKTPNYAIYLETGLPKIFTSTLKTQADYILKVLDFPESRLVWKMLQYEIRNKDWWMEKWRNLGEVYGENTNIIPGDRITIKDRLYRTIQKFEDNQRALLVAEAQQSDSRFLYSKLNYNLEADNYFCDSHSYQQISLIFKTRCEVLGLNGAPYNGSFDRFCTLCNLKSKEDCFHFIGVCPIYAVQRQQYLGAKYLTVQETVNLLNGPNWKNLYLFLKSAYNYRMLLITEFD
ncbi:uncharacterized protein LOC129950390 [Eupeodes corollae]|uniref:uncharacterized protein LOC129950390 n=1 Tax=Eupeodes corollae TaxID=290404 RepID=UPI002491F714|nr:uncharacterized protein LOC129950390 [Eupeodes corollae]